MIFWRLKALQGDTSLSCLRVNLPKLAFTQIPKSPVGHHFHSLICMFDRRPSYGEIIIFTPTTKNPIFCVLAGWVCVVTWTAQSWLSVNPSKPAFTHQIPSSHTTHTYLPFHHIHLFGHSNPRERSNGVDSVID